MKFGPCRHCHLGQKVVCVDAPVFIKVGSNSLHMMEFARWQTK